MLRYLRDALRVKASNDIYFEHLLSFPRPARVADRSYLTLHVSDDRGWRPAADVEDGIVGRGAVERVLLGERSGDDGILMLLVGTEKIVRGKACIASVDAGSDMLGQGPRVGPQAHHRHSGLR